MLLSNYHLWLPHTYSESIVWQLVSWIKLYRRKDFKYAIFLEYLILLCLSILHSFLSIVSNYCTYYSSYQLYEEKMEDFSVYSLTSLYNICRMSKTFWVFIVCLIIHASISSKCWQRFSSLASVGSYSMKVSFKKFLSLIG